MALLDDAIRSGSTCSVHNVSCDGQLRAPHIIPWSHDESRRADVNNGLLLSVPLDDLFDRGFITFSDDGCWRRSEVEPALRVVPK